MVRYREIPDDYDGGLDDDDFADWCADNDIDPDEEDAWSAYKESKEELRDPYGSRGLRMSDFL